MSYSQALEEQIRWTRWLKRERSEPGDESWTDQRLRFTERALETGETYYWAPGICRLITDVASSLPDSWRFSMNQLPSQSGFFWFSAGMPCGFSNTNATGVMRAIVWSSGVLAGSEKAAANIATIIEDERRFPSVQSFVVTEGMTAREAMDGITEGHHDSSRGDQAQGVAMLLTFASCLTFLEQRILIAPQQRPERSTRKRLEREGFTHEPLVRVVELRRKQVKSEHHGDSDPVEWSHQWIVSGHWRQQWYPSLNANQPIWVMPYVKGPEDKPLKPPRAKVFAVVR